MIIINNNKNNDSHSHYDEYGDDGDGDGGEGDGDDADGGDAHHRSPRKIIALMLMRMLVAIVPMLTAATRAAARLSGLPHNPDNNSSDPDNNSSVRYYYPR